MQGVICKNVYPLKWSRLASHASAVVLEQVSSLQLLECGEPRGSQRKSGVIKVMGPLVGRFRELAVYNQLDIFL